ncbi:MAG: ABC transporter ATP-binding protein [Planctomycetota bacterium]|nr:MAG: ABC transporter ATP-binding protein [Planctomycetota bacterium]
MLPFLMLATDPGRFLHSPLGVQLVTYFPQLDTDALIITAGLFAVAMMMLANAASLLAEVMRARYAHGLGHWLQLRLVRHVLSQPYAYHLRRNSSVLTKTIVNDVDRFTHRIVFPLYDVFCCVSTSFFLLVALFVLEPWAAPLAIFALGSYYGLVFRVLRRRRQEVSQRMNAAMQGQFFVLGQLFSSLKMILTRHCEAFFAKRFEQSSSAYASAATRIPVYSSGPKYLLEPVAFGALMVWIIVEIAAGNDVMRVLPAAGMVAMACYRLLPSLQLLYGRLVVLTSMRHAVDEIVAELRSAARAAPPATSQPTSERSLSWQRTLELVDVTFAYPNATTSALRQLNLQICKGEFAGLVGATGSGKSTAADILLGLLEADEGQVRLDGRPLGRDDMPAWRERIGYVPQKVVLLDTTIEENIAFGLPREAIDPERVREAARVAQMLEFIEGHLPHGFQTPAGECGAFLSGGQQQRIGLARALYFEPELLVLDEATSALDNDTVARVIEAIRSNLDGVTILAIAHRLNTVRGCDTIFYMHGGVIECQGRFDELTARCPGFRRLAQLGEATQEAA